MTSESINSETHWGRLAFSVTSGRVVGQGLELIAWIIIARKLGPNDNGRVVVAFLWVRYLSLIVDWGGTLTGARDGAIETHSLLSAPLIGFRRLMGLAMAVIFAGVALYRGENDLAILAVAVLAAGYQVDWLALGRQNSFGAIAPSILRGAILLLGGVLVGNVRDFAIVITTALVGAALISIRIIRPVAVYQYRSIPSFWPLIAVLAAQIYISFDTIIIAAFRGNDEAGIYGAVYRVPTGMITVLGLVVSTLVPAVSIWVSDSELTLRVIVRRTARIGCAAMVVVLAIAPIAWLIFPWIFGHPYASGRLPMMILIFGVAITATSAPLGATMIALRLERMYAIILCFGATVNLALNLILVRPYGMVAAAGTTAFSELIVFISIAAGLRWALNHQH